MNGNEKARLEVDSFLYGNGYTLTGKKTATDGGRAEIDVEWYNYMGEKLSVTQFESDKIADDFSLEFLAPQGTYAKIVLRNSGSGKVTFGDITVEKPTIPSTIRTAGKAIGFASRMPTSLTAELTDTLITDILSNFPKRSIRRSYRLRATIR